MHWRTDHTGATHKPRQPPVDRRCNGARYDADLIVAAFAARLEDTVGLDSLRDGLAAVTDRALEPAHICVRMSERGVKLAWQRGTSGPARR
jgi:hypothetical protein